MKKKKSLPKNRDHATGQLVNFNSVCIHPSLSVCFFITHNSRGFSSTNMVKDLHAFIEFSATHIYPYVQKSEMIFKL